MRQYFFLMIMTILCGVHGLWALEEPVHVMVSIAPLVQVAERIGGDYVRVQSLVPPQADPHVFEPTSGQIRAFAETQLFLALGTGFDFERVWLPKLRQLYPNIPIVSCAEKMTLIPMGQAGHSHEGHRHGHSHAAGAPDPHVWLSPSNIIITAGIMRDALCRIDPDHAAFYRENAKRYILEVQLLKAAIRQELEPLKQRKFMVFHPSWGYFARDFDLQQIAIEIDGKTPGAKDLARLITMAKREGISVVFVSPQFSTSSAEQIAHEINGAVVPIDPMALDYLINLKQVAQALAMAGASKQ